jgi:hypothetical protein
VASAALPEQGAADEAGEFEDLELEGARRFVRLAADAARKIANAEASDDPRSGAGVAVLAGAKRLAPGLTETTEPSRATLVSLAPQSGRWVRRGNVIVLLGL